MKAEELTGKRALRIVETQNTDLPFSLTKVPVIIEKATETHIVCRVDNSLTPMTAPQSEPAPPKKSIAKRILFCFIPQFLAPKPPQAQKQEIILPDTPFLLDQPYCDDNWIDFDELVGGTSLDTKTKSTEYVKPEYGFLLSTSNIALLILAGVAAFLALTYLLNLSTKWAMNIAVVFSVLLFGGEMFFAMLNKRKEKSAKGGEVDEQK